jgi:hypothetical protein
MLAGLALTIRALTLDDVITQVSQAPRRPVLLMNLGNQAVDCIQAVRSH